MSFRELLYDALNTQLEERIPFLFTAISDFHEHSLTENSVLINEMAAAAGFSSKLDPLVLQCIQTVPKSNENDDYMISCLLMVFVAVTIPKLAKSEASIYKVINHLIDFFAGKKSFPQINLFFLFLFYISRLTWTDTATTSTALLWR